MSNKLSMSCGTCGGDTIHCRVGMFGRYGGPPGLSDLYRWDELGGKRKRMLVASDSRYGRWCESCEALTIDCSGEAVLRGTPWPQ